MDQYLCRRVKIWNDGNNEHIEKFKGDIIKIPAKSFVEMGRADGVNFLGQYCPVVRDGAGNQTREKRLRMEWIEPANKSAAKVEHKCMLCAQDFKSAKALAKHSDDMHPNEQIKEE